MCPTVPRMRTARHLSCQCCTPVSFSELFASMRRSRLPGSDSASASLNREMSAFRPHFRDSIDRLCPDGCIFGPIGNQSPAYLRKLALWLMPVLADGRDLIRGSNVPSSCPFDIFRWNVEILTKPAFLGCEFVTSTHYLEPLKHPKRETLLLFCACALYEAAGFFRNKHLFFQD